MTPPPWRWSLDEFERIGKELVRKANIGHRRREVFFCSPPDALALTRSMGLDRFNETMTRCTLDDPRFAEVLRRIYQWSFQDNIMPTPEDLDAFSAQRAGYGGNEYQLFNRGNLAMVHSGHFALIQFRDFNATHAKRGEEPMDLVVPGDKVLRLRRAKQTAEQLPRRRDVAAFGLAQKRDNDGLMLVGIDCREQRGSEGIALAANRSFAYTIVRSPVSPAGRASNRRTAWAFSSSLSGSAMMEAMVEAKED